MNAKTIETNWTELKGKIKAKWGKFNDEEVESLKSDLSQLAGKIQATYGIAKDQAEHQFEEFKKSVQSLTGQDAPAAGAKAEPTFVSVTPPKPNLAAAAPLAIKPAVRDTTKESQAV
jgi:uncharacterized protein YjbJ (UPF0337 family)